MPRSSLKPVLALLVPLAPQTRAIIVKFTRQLNLVH